MSAISRLRLPIVAALIVGLAVLALLPAAFGQSQAVPSVVRNALAQSSRVQDAPSPESLR